MSPKLARYFMFPENWQAPLESCSTGPILGLF